MRRAQTVRLEQNIWPGRIDAIKNIGRDVGQHGLDALLPLSHRYLAAEYPQTKGIAKFKPVESRKR